MRPDLQKLKVLLDVPPPMTKKECQAFFGIINYLGTSFPSMVELCESLRKVTIGKTEQTQNATYQKIFYKAKSIIKGDACMRL